MSRQPRLDFLRLVEALPLPVAVIGPEREVLYLNPAAGLKAGGRCYELLAGQEEPCDARAGGVCPAREALASGRVQEALRELELGGERRSFEILAAPVAGPDGPEAVVEVFRDVTGSMLLRRMQEARDRLRMLEEMVPDAIVTLDVNGRVVAANRAVERIFGVDPARLRREGLGLVLPPDIRERHLEALSRAAARGRLELGAEPVEVEALRPDGSPVTVELTLAMWNRGGAPMFTAVIRDVSERKRIEAEREQRHEKLAADYNLVETIKKQWQLILDSVPDPVLMADAEDRIVRCNRALAGLTKASYQEMIGRQWKEFVTSRGLEDGDFWGDNLTMVDRGRERVYAVRVNALRDEGGMPGTVVVFRDVTDEFWMTRELEEANARIKQAQAQLLQQEKMASIGQLAAGVAHEINNPVGFIASNLGSMARYADRLRQYLEAVEERAAGDGELSALRKKLKIDFILDDLGDLVRECIEGTDRVRDIVLNLKSFSRIDQSGEKPADINECIESTLKIVWNELKYKATVEKELGELPLTLCHAQQLNQVFMNLLVNAAQAIEEQGTITIRSWCGEGEGGERRIFVSISDTGCGIPADQLDRVFEPFFTTKEVGRGTGLGLAIVYDIVTNKHGGEIRVESEVGKGTTFTVEIPVREEEDGDDRS